MTELVTEHTINRAVNCMPKYLLRMRRMSSLEEQEREARNKRVFRFDLRRHPRTSSVRHCLRVALSHGM